MAIALIYDYLYLQGISFLTEFDMLHISYPEGM